MKQAEQRVLARDAQRKRDEMYDRERLDAMIDAAGNVTSCGRRNIMNHKERRDSPRTEISIDGAFGGKIIRDC